MQDRKLVTIRRVKEIKPIKKADLIELIIVDGWHVVAKKGEFKVGDKAVYFEIDSFLPLLPEFEFLEKTSKKKMNEVDGLRLKTIKLRGQISQGLLLPYNSFERFYNNATYDIGDDITDLLGVIKYETPIPTSLAGDVKGNFPSFIRKTDQERIQNLFDEYSADYLDNNEHMIGELEMNPIKNLSFEESLKLDGTSYTYYIANTDKYSIKVDEDMDVRSDVYFGHCSRNLESKENESTPWIIAKELGFKEELHKYYIETNRSIAVQGELMGPKIQGNREKLSKGTFYVFEVWDIDNQCYFTPLERKDLIDSIEGLVQVPILNTDIKPFIKFHTIEDILDYAKGASITHKIREGVVFKSNGLVDGNTISFKVINNDFLLNGGD